MRSSALHKAHKPVQDTTAAAAAAAMMNGIAMGRPAVVVVVVCAIRPRKILRTPANQPASGQFTQPFSPTRSITITEI